MAKTWKVDGYKEVSYTSRKTGKPVSGVSLYVSRSIDGEGDNCFGREVKELWLNERATYLPMVGDEVCIIFNDRGYVDDVISYGDR